MNNFVTEKKIVICFKLKFLHLKVSRVSFGLIAKYFENELCYDNKSFLNKSQFFVLSMMKVITFPLHKSNFNGFSLEILLTCFFSLVLSTITIIVCRQFQFGGAVITLMSVQ